MDTVQVLLVAFDGAWNGAWESLADACKDLTEETASWQPPEYSDEPHDEGVGRPGTILWHLNHLEMCHRHYTDTLRAIDPDNPPKMDVPGELPFEAVREALDKATGELRSAIVDLKPDDLTRQVHPERTVANFIAMASRHITWHAGMIKQTRRLHAHRG